MPVLLTAVEAKSSRPSMTAVSNQMNRSLQVVYDYFALEGEETGRTATHQQIMARVTSYLDDIQDQLIERNLIVRDEQEDEGPDLVPASVNPAAAIATTTQSRYDPSVCPACSVPIGNRRYGLLKSCSDKICEPCVRAMLVRNRSSGGVECAACHRLSDRVVFSDTFHPSGSQAKSRLFESLLCLNNHRPTELLTSRPSRMRTRRRLSNGRH